MPVGDGAKRTRGDVVFTKILYTAAREPIYCKLILICIQCTRCNWQVQFSRAKGVMKQRGVVMNKCLRITLMGDYPPNFLVNFIQKHAKTFDLEGTAQLDDAKEGRIKIIICGSSDALDDFLDALYQGTKGFELHDLEIEPFLKDKDYRQVFRVIE